ncbi:MAG: SAM-dependent methyltransferase [Geminicoccaceae bacterium]
MNEQEKLIREDQGRLNPGGFWDDRYREDAYFYGITPNGWLMAQASLLPSAGKALAVADGEGRNGVWLAEQGLTVTSVDVSAKGLAKTRALAADRGVEVETIEADLRHWAWPVAAYDVVVSIFAHFPPDLRVQVHRGIGQALRPGGLLVLEAYSPYQRIHATGGPKALDLLYTAWQVAQDLKGLDVFHLEETEVDLAEGKGHRGRSAVVRLLARREAQFPIS